MFWRGRRGEPGECRLVRRTKDGSERVLALASPRPDGIACNASLACAAGSLRTCVFFTKRDNGSVIIPVDLETMRQDAAIGPFSDSALLLELSYDGKEAYLLDHVLLRIKLATKLQSPLLSGPIPPGFQYLTFAPNHRDFIATLGSGEGFALGLLRENGQFVDLIKSDDTWITSPVVGPDAQLAAYQRRLASSLHVLDQK